MSFHGDNEKGSFEKTMGTTAAAAAAAAGSDGDGDDGSGEMRIGSTRFRSESMRSARLGGVSTFKTVASLM